jgi:glutathione S-transferase
MTITITGFEQSPDGGKGLARDTRVRWALEEVDQSYEVRLGSFRAMKEPAHRGFILSARLRPMRGDKTWHEGRLPLVEDRVRDRLDQLSGRLGDATGSMVRSARPT